jgi:hypothetical protein
MEDTREKDLDLRLSKRSLGKTFCSEEQGISMLEFRIDNIFVSFGGTLYQQVVGITELTTVVKFEVQVQN